MGAGRALVTAPVIVGSTSYPATVEPPLRADGLGTCGRMDAVGNQSLRKRMCCSVECRHLFAGIHQRASASTFHVRCQFLEIYNEEVGGKTRVGDGGGGGRSAPVR